MPKTAAKPVILVTGAGGGIGLAIVRRFLDADWIVVGTTRDPSPEALAALHVDIRSVDMRRPEQVEAAVSRVVGTYGRLDAVVLNAGYGMVGPLESTSWQDMAEIMTVNLTGAAYLAAKAVAVMRRQGYGVIIGMSSIAGRVGIPGFGVYSGSKFGLEGVLEALWYETAGTKIQVRLIEPSVTDTPFWRNLVKAGEGPRGSGINRFIQRLLAGSAKGLKPAAVAEVVYRAAIGRSTRLRYPIGLTMPLGFLKRLLPESTVRRLVTRFYYGKR